MHDLDFKHIYIIDFKSFFFSLNRLLLLSARPVEACETTAIEDKLYNRGMAPFNESSV